MSTEYNWGLNFTSGHIAFFMACNKPSMTLPKISWGREDTDDHMKMRIQSDQDNISEIELRHGKTRGLSRLDWRLARARYPDDPPGNSCNIFKMQMFQFKPHPIPIWKILKLKPSGGQLLK